MRMLNYCNSKKFWMKKNIFSFRNWTAWRLKNVIIKTNTLSQMKNLKKLWTIIILLLLTVEMSYSQTLSITEIQRDSIYNKIQRGIINAERVRYLQQSLSVCDSASNVKSSYMKLQQLQINALEEVYNNDQVIIQKLEENVKREVKRGRKRGFWNFIKGIGVGLGAGITAVLLI